MRTATPVAAIALAAPLALLPGCIIVTSHEVPPSPPAPIILDARGVGPTGVVADELRVIEREFASSSDRADALERIATRPHLTGGDQIAIVDAACRLVVSSGDRVDIFARLARNPWLTDVGYRAILDDAMACITSASDRRDLLEVLQHRAAAGWIDPPHDHAAPAPSAY